MDGTGGGGQRDGGWYGEIKKNEKVLEKYKFGDELVLYYFCLI